MSMIFRGHARIPLEPYWHDVGFRGTVRLHIKSEKFWADVHRDVGAVDDENDPAQLIVVSHILANPSDSVVALLNNSYDRQDPAPNIRSTPTSRNHEKEPVPKPLKTPSGEIGDAFEAFPNEYREFLRHTALRLGELTTRTLEVALWRTGARGGPAGVEFYPPHLNWRKLADPTQMLLDSEWQQVPSGIITIGLPDVSFFDLDRAIASDISHLLDAGARQPFGHDLLREAWRIHESNPRAALVVVVAAVETGVKEFLAKQLPQTEWLLRNLAAPPLHKLIRELLPTVPSRAQGHNSIPAIDTSIVRALKEAVELRNSLVHAGYVEIKQDWLAIVFTAARRLLYELDYHGGYDWAPKVVENIHPWGREWSDKDPDA